MAIDDFKITKNITGKLFVSYRCPRCKEPLKNPIDQAGTSDKCPSCETSFLVPGVEKKREYLEYAAKQAARKKSQDEEQRRREDQQSQLPEDQPTTRDDAYNQVYIAHREAEENRLNQQEQMQSALTKVAQLPFSTFEVLLFLIAALLFAGTTLYVLIRFFLNPLEPYGFRFRGDNAVGATANALEYLTLQVASWASAFVFLLVLLYIKVSQIFRYMLLRGNIDSKPR